MDFFLETTGTGGIRYGNLNMNGFNVATPNFMVNTKAGSVPFVSIDILEKLKILPSFIQIPIDNLISSKDVIQKFNGGVNDFTALIGSPIYCCLHDPTVLMTHGFTDIEGVALWGKSGKIKVDVEEYMDFIESLRPSLFQGLCDSVYDEATPKKRIRKGVDRSIGYLDECIARLKNSKVLTDSKIIGTIAGGFDHKEVHRSATEINKREVFGYSFDGFDVNSLEISQSKFKSILNLLSTTLPLLNKLKVRFLPGIFNLYEIVVAARSGIDIFDSSYVYSTTEKKCALTINFNYLNKDIYDSQENIDLSDKKYVEDFSPISPNCECYTCKSYTRSYIHHLIISKELLASTLLYMHNLQVYKNFFHQLKTIQSDQELSLFENYLKLFYHHRN